MGGKPETTSHSIGKRTKRWTKQQHPKIYTGRGKHPWMGLIKSLDSTFSTFPCPLPINNSSLPTLLFSPVSPRDSNPLLGLARNLCPEVFCFPNSSTLQV